MFCSHCGKKIDETKIEKKSSSYALAEGQTDAETKITYVCPQCGYLIHEDLSDEDVKSLSRSAHAQLQRGSNDVATGMCFTSIGIIMLIVAIIFFTLARKPSNHFQLVTNCAEFYVSLVLFATSLILLVFGIIKLVKGLNKKIIYTKLLKDINNKTFIQ